MNAVVSNGDFFFFSSHSPFCASVSSVVKQRQCRRSCRYRFTEGWYKKAFSLNNKITCRSDGAARFPEDGRGCVQQGSRPPFLSMVCLVPG